MQNKGLVKLFALLFGLVSVYQLSFTFKANQIEESAALYAENKISAAESDYDTKRAIAQNTYLDSLANTEVFNLLGIKYTYDEVKDKTMNLGLI